MIRRIRTIVAFLVVGAIVNVAVASLLVSIRASEIRAFQFATGSREANADDLNLWRTHLADEWIPDPQSASCADRFGLSERVLRAYNAGLVMYSGSPSATERRHMNWGLGNFA